VASSSEFKERVQEVRVQGVNSWSEFKESVPLRSKREIDQRVQRTSSSSKSESSRVNSRSELTECEQRARSKFEE